MLPHLALYLGSWDLSSGLHAWTASPLFHCVIFPDSLALLVLAPSLDLLLPGMSHSPHHAFTSLLSYHLYADKINPGRKLSSEPFSPTGSQVSQAGLELCVMKDDLELQIFLQEGLEMRRVATMAATFMPCFMHSRQALYRLRHISSLRVKF